MRNLMDYERISAGSQVLDDLLNGGFEKGVVTTIYGPGGSGKTNICILTLIRMAGQGSKIIYIDTEASFSVERLKQITQYPNKVLDHMIFFTPTSFAEQHTTIQQLQKIMHRGVGLIIVDSISMLYRLELGQKGEAKKINSALAKQIAILIKCAREHNIAIITTNQVYSDFHNKEQVKMVGGDILRNGSRCLIELQSMPRQKRRAHLHKHRSLPNRFTDFVITQKGIEKK
jgi:DNA repair protein RadB